MNILPAVTMIMLLIVSSTVNAGRYGYDGRDNWNNNGRNNGYPNGRYDGSGNNSGDWDTDIQFDVQVRGDGDAEGYINGNLGGDWDEIELHQYDNNTMRSTYINNGRITDRRISRDRPGYRDGRRPHDDRGWYYGPYPGPYYGPGYDDGYTGPRR